MDLMMGQSIGDYGILREVGNGGMGRVYEAIHSVTHRHEAIKVLNSDTSPSLEQSERFLREIRLQAALTHPNIAAVHNAFWNDDSLVLVCELLEGSSLQTLLERGRISLPRSIEILGQVLSALSYAHSRGVIHRDISPANIFVTAATGAVKLIDFGLAKTTSDLNLTQSGAPAGSYHYMSPEQVRGGQSLDARTDIYSAGAVLYELVTGKKLFEGESAFTLMQSHCERTPEAPRTLDSDVPKELEAAILKALAKNAEDRFQSADSFQKALDRILPAAEHHRPPLLSAPWPSNVRTWTLALVSLGIALGAAAIFTIPRAQAVPPTGTGSTAMRAPAVPGLATAKNAEVLTPIAAPIKAAPSATPSPLVVKQARTITPSSQNQVSAVAPSQKPETSELAVVDTGGIAPEPSVDQDSVGKKDTPKVLRAIKRLNPFRGKNNAQDAAAR